MSKFPRMNLIRDRLPADLDKECAPLVEALNQIPGINTIESCCGHGIHPFRIFFVTDSLDCLPNLLYWFDVCHSGTYAWEVIVCTDCSRNYPTFIIEGPTGEKAYTEANKIAALILNDVEIHNRSA